jgi:hypothetical protein
VADPFVRSKSLATHKKFLTLRPPFKKILLNKNYNRQYFTFLSHLTHTTDIVFEIQSIVLHCVELLQISHTEERSGYKLHKGVTN